jgi:hypothetical protein
MSILCFLVLTHKVGCATIVGGNGQLGKNQGILLWVGPRIFCVHQNSFITGPIEDTLRVVLPFCESRALSVEGFHAVRSNLELSVIIVVVVVIVFGSLLHTVIVDDWIDGRFGSGAGDSEAHVGE